MATSSRGHRGAGQIKRAMKSFPLFDCLQITAKGIEAAVPASRRLSADDDGASSRSDPAGTGQRRVTAVTHLAGIEISS